jgi:hypothetical protein
MASQPRPTVDDYVAAVAAPMDEVASELRRVIREAVPEAVESMKWGQPVYSVDGPFVALKAHPRHVTLTFWRGAELAGAHQLLDGDGERMRHARFASVSGIDHAGLAELVRAAADLNRRLGDPTKRG